MARLKPFRFKDRLSCETRIFWLRSKMTIASRLLNSRHNRRPFDFAWLRSR